MSDTLLQCVTPSADAAGVRAWEAIDLGADAAAVARVASLTGDATIASGVLSLTQVRTSERRGALLLRAWGRYPALRTLRVQVNPDPNLTLALTLTPTLALTLTLTLTLTLAPTWTEERFHRAVTSRRSAVSLGPRRAALISGSCEREACALFPLMDAWSSSEGSCVSSRCMSSAMAALSSASFSAPPVPYELTW